MEAYDMSKSDLGFNVKLGSGPCSSLPSLAHVLAVVSALLLFGTPCFYSLFVLQAHASLVVELQTEVHALRQRVDQLESLHTTQIYTKEEQDKYLRKLLIDSSKDNPKSEEEKEKLTGDSDSSVDFLDKLFRDLELGSGSDSQLDADLQNTEPGELVPEMVGRDSLHVSEEEEDYRVYQADHSEETPLRHDSDKLLTNRKQDRNDVTWETTNRESARERPKRQAENRESRNRNRDRKASKGSSKRNRGNRGSTGRREQESEQAQQPDGGDRRQRSRCQCPRDPPPQPEAAYIHFVGNVSSLVDTHPERTHPLSPRMVNISENLLSDWAYARWTTHRQKRKFGINNGVVTVTEPGTYFVYSQVQFFDDDRYTGHVITINGEETFKCAESPPQRPRNLHTCYVGGLVNLHRDSRVAVRVAFPHRWVNMHHDSAYFGMYKVA